MSCGSACISTLAELQVDEAGIDILLVGDSVAMVVHGHDTTLPITMDEMLVHCRRVGLTSNLWQSVCWRGRQRFSQSSCGLKLTHIE